MSDPTGITCVVCGKRPAERGYVCDTSRSRLSGQLRTIDELYALLPAALDDRTVHAIVDLTLPARHGTVTDTRIPLMVATDVDVKVLRTAYPGGIPTIIEDWLHMRELRRVYDDAGRGVLIPAGDQIGGLPVAAILASWTRDWAKTRGERDLPAPVVPELVAWLRDRERFTWACNHHPAMNDFASETRLMLRMIRLALHRDLSPVRYLAPCPYCHDRTLQRGPGADWIECRDCHRLWGEDEYGLLARAAISADEMLDTNEAAIIAQVSVEVIRQWRSRGKLACEYDERGRAWQRRADVDAAKEMAA